MREIYIQQDIRGASYSTYSYPYPCVRIHGKTSKHSTISIIFS